MTQAKRNIYEHHLPKKKRLKKELCFHLEIEFLKRDTKRVISPGEIEIEFMVFFQGVGVGARG